MWLCCGVFVKNYAHVLFYRRRHPMGRKNVTLFLTFVHMIMTYDDIRQWYGLGACKLFNICFIDYNAKIK